MRIRARAVGIAVVCVVALAGCSQLSLASDPGSGGGFHLAQVDGGPPTKDRSLRVEHVSTPPGNRYEWTVASVDPTSRRLRVFYTDGACTSADRLAVEETARTVVIGITASKTFQGNCIAVGIARATTITLRKPLGGRALMEGATGVNDGLPKVSDPASLPGPVCSTEEGTGRDVPVGLPDALARIAPNTVTKAFVCRTWWPKGSAHVASTTITDPAKLAALTKAIDVGSLDLREGPPSRLCRTTDSHASLYAITLDGPGVRVEVRTDAISCDTITNGAASGTMTRTLVRTLDALFVS